MTASNRELLKGSLDLMVLTLLENEPMYGYQMVKEVKQRSNDTLQLKEGSLYPALHRLEQAGLIESFWQARDQGVNRRYYQLTAKGREVLPERQAAWHEFVKGVRGVLG
jgi:PadR family transcriptional regulator PadR